MKKKMTAVILAMTLCLALSVTALAADTSSMDLSRDGSIIVTLYSDENEAAVTDGKLSLYEVASLYLDGGKVVYAKTDDFVAFEGVLDVDDPSLSDELAAYVAESSLVGISAQPDSEGVFSFTGLELGLYLVIQTEQSTGYYTIDPFLVTVPMNGEGEWIYAVDATPKTEIELIPEEPENPDEPKEPENPEEPGESEENENPEEPVVPTTPGGTSGGGTTGGASTSGTLPQTGQLNWPIPLLAVGGGVLVVLGCVLMRRKQTNAA